MEADCGFSQRIGAFDSGMQGPASGGRPDFLPKTADGQKDRMRLAGRPEGVGKEKPHGGDAVKKCG